MKIVLFTLALASGASAQSLTPERVLVLYNSQNAESLAVRNAYVAARPGVLEFDLDHPNLGPGALTRGQYRSRVRDPLRSHLQTVVGGTALAETVIAIATTRGLPARINGNDEFTLASERASLESELSVLFQDLDAAGSGSLPFQYSGMLDNPYHFMTNAPIASFSRSNIQTAAPFSRINLGPGQDAWSSSSLTPGDLYLVCRLDAGAGASTTALEETLALIERSSDPAQMHVSLACVQALLDEFPAGNDQLDDDGASPLFPSNQDFEQARSVLLGMGVTTTHDETTNFITGPELSGTQPLLVLGTYGENHDLDGAGDNPPGQGTYLTTYTPHPAGVVVTYESFSGNCLIDGTQRQNQACATDWIVGGGSFAIPTVAEPFTLAVADLEAFVPNMYIHGMTFAESAYASMPAISWTNVPVGDPLARVSVGSSSPADLSGDGAVDSTDLAILLAAWDTPGADFNGDGNTDSSDLAVLLAAWGTTGGCP